MSINWWFYLVHWLFKFSQLAQIKEKTSKMFLTLLIVSLFYTTQLPVAKAACSTYSYITGQNGKTKYQAFFGYHKNSLWFVFPGPTDWPTNCVSPDGQCDGTAQSPIDIDPSTTSTVKSWLRLQLIHYEVDPYKMYIENTGHTAKITYEADDCTHIPTVIQGNLIGKKECHNLGCQLIYEVFLNRTSISIGTVPLPLGLWWKTRIWTY